MSIELPEGCLRPDTVRSLARAMDRMISWRGAMYGPSLRSVRAESSGLIARVTVGRLVTYRLELRDGYWAVV